MGLQNQNMNLVLSTDAKPRLKWTPELHHRFVEAINQLGEATPKSLMRVMGIPGLTLYHLKSHLQKYRLGKGHQAETCIDNNQEDYGEVQSGSHGHFNTDMNNGNHNQINENFQIAQALQVQMEVQRKLHEQIELNSIFQVQRHLQLRIEAQGKYLQSVLKKAQETLAGYSSSSVGIELAKAELSRLVSMVNTGCPSSSFSELTEVGDSIMKDVNQKGTRGTICSMESSLTSSESSGGNDNGGPSKVNTCLELPLMAIHPEKKPWSGDSSNQAVGRKRSCSTISDGICVEQPLSKMLEIHQEKRNDQLGNSGFLGTLDLNSQYHLNDSEQGPKAIDLN
ncbi:myb family transcription factor PHL8-like isoform X2 [Carica papaya]|uniref:myb family transcription factor PHL8-like isoform X2 n=1 Tax=Carica papaya TaxID=3649 RepID=UPI000B8CC5EA|nr:myb family transcription factor PHL8-like isoform X2 [Carica papaya]